MVIIPNVMILFFCFYLFLTFCSAGHFYITVERPVIQYRNPEYLPYLNITSRRFGRKNPKYYVDIHASVSTAMDNNLAYDIFFYEFVNNHYRPSFLEMHFKWCNLFLKDSFFGVSLRATLPGKCPHPPGSYHAYNLTMNDDAIPADFPFTKGRLIMNATREHQRVASCYADIELKKNKQKNQIRKE